MTRNKANKSKILALILGLTMCLALMLGIVFASPTSMVYAEGETLTPYDRIYINSEALNSGWYLDESYTQKKGNPTSGYVAKYNNGVLTLNNYSGGNIGTSAPASGYYKIDLIGENTINGGQRGVFIDTSKEGRVTITSSVNGKLTINVSSATSVWGIACGASNSVKTTDVVIGGNAQVTINATSNGENAQVEGIHARNVTIQDNASVNITAKNTNNSTASQWVAGIFAKNNATINTNGNIDIDVSVAGGDSSYSYGIQTSNVTFPKITDMTIKWEKGSGNGLPISPKDKVDSTTHAINEDHTNCYASYRYGTPRYVAAINGALAGPGVPKEANSGSGYFLAGDEITLNAPSLQVSKTDTTNIPFDKWFSFASDAVITNATSQNGAKLTVQDKDIEVRANYNAFTAQPVFERESDRTGTVTFTLISNGFNQGKWLKIRPINDLTISKGNVVSVDGTTYNATLSDTGTVYGTPAGEYVVEVVYNNRTLYSEPFTVDYTEKKATIDSVTISGEQGEPIANTDITVTLTGYTFETALSGDWITNLPDGLVQSVTRISDTEAKITVSGTPTALSDQFVEITIPKANITGLASDLTAESNSDAKFNIVATLTEIAIPKAKTNLTYARYKGKLEQAKKEHNEFIFYAKKDIIRSSVVEKKVKATRKPTDSIDKKRFIKSPMNYIGGKYKLLPQLMPLFPQNINTFVDLFAGGFNVVVNVKSNKTICNDLNYLVVEMVRTLAYADIDIVLKRIDEKIAEYGLSKENEEGFKAFRNFYNANHNPIDLLTLSSFSFNYQFRFNSNLEYNNPFGRNRSQFSETMRQNLILFMSEMKKKNLEFYSRDFREISLDGLSDNDFIYCDPPYLITNGSYNDGNRGFHDWGTDEERALYEYLDEANKRNIKFALSNVLFHKGTENKILVDWSKKYKIHHINSDYSNCNYQYKNKKTTSVEVLITNY